LLYNRKGQHIGEYTEDDTEIPAVPPENEIPGVRHEIPGVHRGNEIPGMQHAIPGVDHETTGVEMDQQQEEFEEQEQNELEILPDQDNNEPEMLEQPDALVQDPAPLRRSTRDRKLVQRLDPKMSGKRHAEVMLPMVNTNQDIEPDWDIVTFKCMTQLSMKAGFERFGKQGEDAVSKELNQLHLRDIFEPVDSTQLSAEEKKSVMESHMFLKQKKDDTVKGRMVAGEIKTARHHRQSRYVVAHSIARVGAAHVGGRCKRTARGRYNRHSECVR
jgi:hypothetical protein